MNRDELLTKLAMELGEWPTVDANVCSLAKQTNGFVTSIGWDSPGAGTREPDRVGVTKDYVQITKHDWIQRRAELINKSDCSETLGRRPANRKTCRHCGVSFQRDSVPHIPDDRCERCHEEIEAMDSEHDAKAALKRAKERLKDDGLAMSFGREQVYDCPRCGGEYWSPPHDYCPCMDRVGQESDPVNHPSHYQSDNGIECIDAIRAALGKEGFIAYCRGNAIKYSWRADRKGKAAEDKRKAAWYLERAARELES